MENTELLALELVDIIQNATPRENTHFNLQKYLGSPDPVLNIPVPTCKQIIKEWYKNHRNLTIQEFVEIAEILLYSKYFEQKTAVSILLNLAKNLRKEIDPKILDTWLDNLAGWAEIDTICTCFEAEIVLDNWSIWQPLLEKLALDSNINKRRASLVLLTNPVSHSCDIRLSTLAFALIDLLILERDILITKAVSWLLRNMVKNFRLEVENYLILNEKRLPKIAIRETKNKLQNGVKSTKK